MASAAAESKINENSSTRPGRIFCKRRTEESAEQRFSLSSEEYLEQYNVEFYILDAVERLLESKPAKPVAAVSDYFKAVICGKHPSTASLLHERLYIRLSGGPAKALAACSA
ncbi:hypothetical protein CYMTET_16312 [Cymbomonas tetramitiformis]|uniref:Uncharacterized protein n=1 Tax=Cymbomonas tetramitiformis TaxID=36881 RepID=A0AAE0GCT1_9CHLO|nr:hypothetical protein CYMTET_16312 [Cymbomonas tetramitiformis]